MRRPICRGITIFELLVVAIIIAVLASILMPAGLSGRAKAKEAVCLSNMRQLYMALQLYEQDNHTYPPCSGQCESLKTYIPATLKCPVSTIAERFPGYHLKDYLLLTYPIGKIGPSLDQTSVLNAFEECKSVRGADIPVVLDLNHSEPVVTTKDSTSRYFLLRASGSISSLLAKDAPAVSPLCSTLYLSNYYNY